jgi:hypothetical protein
MRPVQYSDLTTMGAELSCQATSRTSDGQQAWLEQRELAKKDGGVTEGITPEMTNGGRDKTSCQEKESLRQSKLKIGYVELEFDGDATETGAGQHQREAPEQDRLTEVRCQRTARSTRRRETRLARVLGREHRTECGKWSRPAARTSKK